MKGRPGEGEGSKAPGPGGLGRLLGLLQPGASPQTQVSGVGGEERATCAEGGSSTEDWGCWSGPRMSGRRLDLMGASWEARRKWSEGGNV